MTMENILKLLSMLITISFGGGVGVFFTLRESVFIIIFIITIYRLLIISLTIFIFDTLRDTALTFKICMERLLDRLLHITI